jgi:hypothetical protein
LPAIVKAQSEAVLVLRQVLHALQLGHVQFLMMDYKGRIIEAYPNAHVKVRPLRLDKDGLPRPIQDFGSTADKSDNTIDLTADDVDDDTSSDINYSDGERNEANTSASSTSQKESQPLQKGTATSSKNNESAGFGSDISPRTY